MLGALLFVFISATASPDAKVQAGIDAYLEGMFVQAITHLDDVSRMSGAPAALRAKARFYLGLTYLALGKRGQAIRHIDEVLEDDPDFTPPPLISPVARELFEDAKKNHLFSPRLSHVPPPRLAKNEDLRLRFESTPIPAAFTAELLLQTSTGGAWALPMKREAHGFAIAVPRTYFADALSVTYSVRVLDKSGQALTGVRSGGEPYKVALDRDIPAYKRPWFWWVIGTSAVVIAAGVTAAVIVTQPSGFGSVDVRLP